ncbi:MAG TPA: hypothetical protein VNI57_10905 [Candidatus Saccharimonadales bacterium]|nr:hypothetical protein [Candidatus Saccharimonadales bacterium]
MQTAREILIETSRRLNERIRSLEESLRAPASAVDHEALRRDSADDLARLRAIPAATGPIGTTAGKVAEHLDLFMDIVGSAGEIPALSGKLLRHLLEEQIELTAAAERGGATMGGGAAHGRARQVTACEAKSLPGGRRPLTVGSLIDH